MKEELTEKMHSEFTVSEEVDVENRVGSAMQVARALGITESGLSNILRRYNVTMDDYKRYKKAWNDVGLFVKE